MSIYQPKRKTEMGVEDITFPASSVEGLEGNTLAMPRIRVGAAIDTDGTMMLSETNPISFTVEIIDGKLQIGDEVQICTRQLFTYDQGTKRKYKLRCEWKTVIDEANVNYRFISVNITNDDCDRLFHTGDKGSNTLSPIYFRVRRPIYKKEIDVNGRFSNIVTVWKKYILYNQKLFVK